MCYLNVSFARYFYLNTVLHLIAVSYERYNAIVKSPLVYDGALTTSRAVFVFLIWVVPISLSFGPFLSFAGKYVYNPEVFVCEQGWSQQYRSSKLITALFAITSFVVPFVVVVFLNWSVFKTAKVKINALEVQMGSVGGSEIQQQEMSRRMKERRAAVDVSIIIAAFLLCFFPLCITGIYRQFVKSIKVPVEVVLATSSIFSSSSLCNPIIYCIRKNDFRRGVKKVFRRIGHR